MTVGSSPPVVPRLADALSRTDSLSKQSQELHAPASEDGNAHNMEQSSKYGMHRGTPNQNCATYSLDNRTTSLLLLRRFTLKLRYALKEVHPIAAQAETNNKKKQSRRFTLKEVHLLAAQARGIQKRSITKIA